MLPARLATLHESVDRQAGERVRVRPQSGGGYVAASDDPERDPAEIVALVAIIPASDRSGGGGPNVNVRMSADTIKYTASALAYELVSGDIVELLDRAGAPAFRVSRTAAFGTDRTVAFLTPAAP